MAKENEDLRPAKICHVKKLIDSGFYDECIQDIVELILSGNTSRRKKFLEVTGIYDQIAKDIKIRANLSFYAAILSMLFGFALLAFGLLLTWKHNIGAGSLIATIGSAISSFITLTFLRVHQISLEQLSRFYRPVMKEILSVIERIIDDISDTDAKEQARISLIGVLLRIIRKTKLDSA